jgi:hypothetical protein
MLLYLTYARSAYLLKILHLYYDKQPHSLDGKKTCKHIRINTPTFRGVCLYTAVIFVETSLSKTWGCLS